MITAFADGFTLIKYVNIIIIIIIIIGYLHNAVTELNSRLLRTNPDSTRVEDLNQGPPDFKSSTLNHSTMPPPHTKLYVNHGNSTHVA